MILVVGSTVKDMQSSHIQPRSTIRINGTALLIGDASDKYQSSLGKQSEAVAEALAS